MHRFLTTKLILRMSRSWVYLFLTFSIKSFTPPRRLVSCDIGGLFFYKEHANGLIMKVPKSGKDQFTMLSGLALLPQNQHIAHESHFSSLNSDNLQKTVYVILLFKTVNVPADIKGFKRKPLIVLLMKILLKFTNSWREYHAKQTAYLSTRNLIVMLEKSLLYTCMYMWDVHALFCDVHVHWFAV